MQMASKDRQGRGGPRSLLAFVNRSQNLAQLALVTVAIFIIMSLLKPDVFLSRKNMLSMGYQIPELGILSIAMMITMLTGGIDLSVVGIADLSAVLNALLMTQVLPSVAPGLSDTACILIGTAVALITGCVCGLFNGLLVSKLHIPEMLTTLGTMEVFAGIAMVLTRGSAVFGVPNSLLQLGNGTFLGIPVPLYIFAVCAVVVALILNYTPFGMELYMQGTNPTAARFSGIRTSANTIKTYILSGLLAAVAGMVILARTASAKADYGSAYTLQCIVVAVLGGVNPNGGFGTMTGLTLALMCLQFLSTGFNILRIGGSAAQYAREMVWGAVLVLVMVLNYFSNRKSGRTE